MTGIENRQRHQIKKVGAVTVQADDEGVVVEGFNADSSETLLHGGRVFVKNLFMENTPVHVQTPQLGRQYVPAVLTARSTSKILHPIGVWT